MLSNAYFLAKFRFDTAESEPAKNLQNFAKNLQNLQILSSNRGRRGAVDPAPAGVAPPAAEVPRGREDRQPHLPQLLREVEGQPVQEQEGSPMPIGTRIWDR